MALPTSGQIDFGQIQTEFGGSNPISMNEYGDKIGLTVGTTSTHDIADFYGLSASLNSGEFGGACTFTTYTYTHDIAVAFDPNVPGTFVVAYRGDSGYGRARHGTISGTTITYGTEVTFNSGSTSYIDISFDKWNTGAFAICYRDYSNGQKGTVRTGAVSGTSLSFGANEYIFETGRAYWCSIDYNPNGEGRAVISFRDYSNSSKGKCVQISTSPTYISIGSLSTYESDGIYTQDAAFNAADDGTNGNNNKGYYGSQFVVAYQTHDAEGIQAQGATCGTTGQNWSSITRGSEAQISTVGAGESGGHYPNIIFDPNNANKFVIVYEKTTTGPVVAQAGSMSGSYGDTTISVGSAVTFDSGDGYDLSAAFSTSGKFITVYIDQSNSDHGTAAIGTYSGNTPAFNSTYTNLVFEASEIDSPRVATDPSNEDSCVVCYQDEGNGGFGTCRVGKL